MAAAPTTTTTMAVAWDRIGAIPVALSAVFVVSTTRTTTAAAPPSPLLQACLKRHLTGLVLLYHHGGPEPATTTTTRTTIALDFAQTRWHFQLQTIRCGGGGSSMRSMLERPQQQCCWVRIAPSTICTFVWTSSASPARCMVQPLETTTTTTTTRTASCVAGAAAAAAGGAALVQEESTSSPACQFLRDTVRYCQSYYQEQQQQQPCPYKSILLTGPPGVGKTHAVRTIGQQYKIPLRVVSGGNVATTAEAQMMELLLGRQPQQRSHPTSDVAATTPMRIVFLDECDALFPASASDSNTENGSTGNSTMESTLCCCLDHMQNVLLVAATNRPDAVPHRVRMRFHHELLLQPPNRTERHQLLRSLLLCGQPQRAGLPPATTTTTTPCLSGQAGQPQQPQPPPEDGWLEVLADDCVGYVAADLAALVARAHLLRVKALAAAKFGSSTKSSLVHENDDETDHTTENDDLENNNDDHLHYYLRLAMQDVGASALRAIVPPSTTLSWDDVVGNHHVKKLLQQAIEWPVTKREAFRRLDLQAPRGILLYGPPGCAKTSLAKAAAHGRAFCCYSPANVYSTSYVGDAEAVIRQAFATARAAAPCILFFDELDAIVVADGASSTRGNHVEARVLSTFLNEMDGLDTTSASNDNEASSSNDNNGVLVLAATNRPSVLDAALLRPGRLDRLIYVPPPDDEARRGILHKYTDGMFEEEAVPLSTHMTGAEIVGACREALLKCAALGRDDDIDIVRRTVTQCLREVKPLLGNPVARESYRESYETSSLMG
jgi:SpoVK/Ycf46/Vps4 family AAA+-type ATPase